MAKSARWSKEPSEKGLARVCQAPRGLLLKFGNEELARVSHWKPSGFGYAPYKGYYWYGCGYNSYNYTGPTFDTVDEAKKAVMLDPRILARIAELKNVCDSK